MLLFVKKPVAIPHLVFETMPQLEKFLPAKIVSLSVLESIELGSVLVRFIGRFAEFLVGQRQSILVIHSGKRHDQELTVSYTECVSNVFEEGEGNNVPKSQSNSPRWNE